MDQPTINPLPPTGGEIPAQPEQGPAAVPELTPLAPQQSAPATPAPQAPATIPDAAIATPAASAPAAPARNDSPAIADDVDVIEKEWVDKAQEIVQATKSDPHLEEEAVENLQIDYLQKRYGTEVTKSEETPPPSAA